MKKHSEVYFTIAILGMIFLMIVPLPGFVLDLFLGLSLAIAAATLLMTLSVRSILEFSSFPALLLFLTFFRLGLNIASVRLILSKGEAGAIITTFGKFVTGDSPVIGFVLFLLLTTINFIVITKGAGRVAEVSARFVLEALPGKQMSIDADIHANVMTRDEAKRARKQVENEAEFYGAMDGASKFVRGEAIAALLITFVNISGAFFVAFTSGKEVLTILKLAIGDGLVNQIPALLISLSAGLMVTRVAHDSVSKVLEEQVRNHPKALFIAALFLLVLGLIPGMPIFLLLPLSFGLLWCSIKLMKKKDWKEESLNAPLEIFLGANKGLKKSVIETNLKALSKELYESLGVHLPKVPIRLSSKDDYQIKLKNVTLYREVGQSAFFLKLKECVFKNAYQFLKRKDIVDMLDQTRLIDPVLADELQAKKITPGLVFKILQNLLKEGVPIHNKLSIFEVLVEQSSLDVDVLSEAIRASLSQSILEKLQLGPFLYVITLDPNVEEMVATTTSSKNLLLRPKTIENIEKKVNEFLDKAKRQGIKPIIITSGKSRLPLCRLLDKYLPQLPIFSYKEVGDVKVHTLGVISDDTLI